MFKFPAVLCFGIMTAFVAHADSLDIMGDWKSASPETQGPITATREFQIADSTWSVVFRAYGDEAASLPLFRLDVGGVYVVGAPSQTVAGASEGIFPATHRDVTAESPQGVAMFAEMGCTLELNVTKSLTSEGCGFVPALMQAMGEYDLVAIKDGQLFFGDRSGDLTKTRPQILTAFPLVRQ